MVRIQADAQARRYFDFAGTMLVVLAPDESILMVNRKASDILGCDEEEMLGLNWFDEFLPDDDRERVRGAFHSLITGDIEPVEYLENRLVTRDGETRLVRWHNNVLRDDRGAIVASVASGEDITEQRSMEEELAASEAKFREIFENSPIGIELYDADGILLDVNQACLDIFGVGTIDSVRGFRLFDDPNMPVEVKGRLRNGKAASYKAVFDFDKVRERELYETSREGEGILDVVITPLSWGDDGDSGFLVQVQEITTRVRAQEKLDRYSHQLEEMVADRTRELDSASAALTTILDSIEALVYVSDMESYELIFMNRYGVEQFGPMDGKRCYEVLQQGRDGPCEFCTNEKLLDSRGEPAGIYNWEFQNTRNGRWYEIHDQAIRWTDGRMVRMEVAEDFTERKQVEEMILESERKYRHVFDECMDGIFVARPDEGVIDMNASGLEILGYSSVEELKSIAPTRQLDGPPEKMRFFQEQLAGKGCIRNLELELKKRDGSALLVAVTASATKDERGEIVEYYGIFRDLTAQKKQEQRIIELQKMESIGRLTGGIAHSFNNLLTGVIGHIDLAAIEVEPDTEAARELVFARDAAIKATDLSLQMMRFAQKEKVDLALTDVKSVIDAVATLMTESIGEKNDIRTSFDTGLKPVMADRKQLGQALVNLVLNASDASPEGGEIEIDARNISLKEADAEMAPDSCPGDFVRISIVDHGSGIDGELLPLIFEPFFSTSNVGAGSGLGLTVAYGIIKQHGGWIEVESEPGSGSTFAVHLPAVADSPLDEAETNDAFDTAGAVQGGVLLVEDEEVVREMTTRMLERSGFSVFTAASVAAGREVFDRNGDQIRVIFTDVVLPDGDGLSLVHELMREKPELKAVFASGYSDDVIDVREIHKRGFHFFQKPYALYQVRRTLARLME